MGAWQGVDICVGLWTCRTLWRQCPSDNGLRGWLGHPVMTDNDGCKNERICSGGQGKGEWSVLTHSSILRPGLLWRCDYNVGQGTCLQGLSQKHTGPSLVDWSKWCGFPKFSTNSEVSIHWTVTWICHQWCVQPQRAWLRLHSVTYKGRTLAHFSASQTFLPHILWGCGGGLNTLNIYHILA